MQFALSSFRIPLGQADGGDDDDDDDDSVAGHCFRAAMFQHQRQLWLEPGHCKRLAIGQQRPDSLASTIAWAETGREMRATSWPLSSSG